MKNFKRFVKEVTNEMVYIAVAVFFGLCFVDMMQVERMVILGIIEATFVATRIYVEVKRINSKKRFEKRKDNVRNFKKERKENKKAQ